MSEGSRIVHAAAFVDALKSSGYKSTYNAISEIVDNSIASSESAPPTICFTFPSCISMQGLNFIASSDLIYQVYTA